MSCKRLAVVVAVVGVFTFLSPASPADAFLKALLKPIVQTISLSVRRGNTYERLEDQRDEQVAEVRDRSKIADWHAERGWLDETARQQEHDRYQAWEQGIVQRTEREKKITRDSYGRAIGVVWREAAIDALTQGMSPRTAGIVRGIARGEDPLRATLDGFVASIGQGGVQPDSLESLRDQWASTKDAFRAIRLPGAVSLESRLADLIARSDRLRQGPGGMGEAVFAQELESLRRAASETQSLVNAARDVFSEWTVSAARMNPSRFERDPRWQQLSAEIAAVSGPTAGKALLAGLVRASEARVMESIAASGVDLDGDAIEAIIAVVATESVAARVAATQAGGSVTDVDFDALVARVIAEHLATAGVDPDQDDDETPAEATESAVGHVPSCPEQLGSRGLDGVNQHGVVMESSPGTMSWGCYYQDVDNRDDPNATGRLTLWWETVTPTSECGLPDRSNPYDYFGQGNVIVVMVYADGRAARGEILATPPLGLDEAEARAVIEGLVQEVAPLAVACGG